MAELQVTQLWMGGVVAMMIMFAAIALVGYLRKRRNRN
jgi:hypothetical protein